MFANQKGIFPIKCICQSEVLTATTVNGQKAVPATSNLKESIFIRFFLAVYLEKVNCNK